MLDYQRIVLTTNIYFAVHLSSFYTTGRGAARAYKSKSPELSFLFTFWVVYMFSTCLSDVRFVLLCYVGGL